MLQWESEFLAVKSSVIQFHLFSATALRKGALATAPMTSLPTAFETPVTIITWLCWPGLSPAWPIASGRKTNGTWTDRYTRKLAIMVNRILECLRSIVSTNFYLLFSISHNWWCVYAEQNMSVPLILCCRSDVHGQESQDVNTLGPLSAFSRITSNKPKYPYLPTTSSK